MLHWLISLGLLGVFLVSIVELLVWCRCQFRGVTDIMVILFCGAACEVCGCWCWAATAGSALGGLFSYQVGQSGGLAIY